MPKKFSFLIHVFIGFVFLSLFLTFVPKEAKALTASPIDCDTVRVTVVPLAPSTGVTYYQVFRDIPPNPQNNGVVGAFYPSTLAALGNNYQTPGIPGRTHTFYIQAWRVYNTQGLGVDSGPSVTMPSCQTPTNPTPTPTPPNPPNPGTVNRPPTIATALSSSGSTSLTVGVPTTLTAGITDPDGNLSLAELWVTTAGVDNFTNISAQPCSGSNCTISQSWIPSTPGQFVIAVNGYDSRGAFDATNTKCTGNPYHTFSTGDPWTPCGSGSSLTVNVAAAPTVSPPVVTVSASAASIANNGTVNITWSSTNNPTSCAVQSNSAWNSAINTSGTVQVGPLPTGTYTFTITCTNAGGSGSAATTVTAQAAAAQPTATLTITPTSGAPGPYTFSWSTANLPTGSNCIQSPVWNDFKPVQPNTSDSDTRSLPAGTHTYSVICGLNSTEIARASATVTITAPPQPPAPFEIGQPIKVDVPSLSFQSCVGNRPQLLIPFNFSERAVSWDVYRFRYGYDDAVLGRNAAYKIGTLNTYRYYVDSADNTNSADNLRSEDYQYQVSYWIQAKSATGLVTASTGPNQGGSAPINPKNCNGPTPPVASCSPSVTTTSVGTQITWSATASGGNGTNQFGYTWLSGSSELNNRTGPTQTIAYNSSGTKSAQIKVRDEVTGLETTQPCTASISVGVDVCPGFAQECDAGTGPNTGTQFCKPGVYNGQRQCVASDSTVCYLDENSTQRGCKPKNAVGSCTEFAPNLTNTNSVNPQGYQIYTTGTADNNGENFIVRINSTRSPAGSPLSLSPVTNITFNPDPQRSGEWFMTVPKNSSTTADAFYTISATVTPSSGTNNTPGVCTPFVVKVPRSIPDTSCPTNITSTEAKLKLVGSNNDPWGTQKTIVLGDSVKVAAFHGGDITTPDGNTVIYGVGPSGSNSFRQPLWPGAADLTVDQVIFTPTLVGTYTINAEVRDKNLADGRCKGQATLTVNARAINTTDYRLAPTLRELDEATRSAQYLSDPTEADFRLNNLTPGANNFVWVRFLSTDGRKVDRNISIQYVGPDPSIDEDISCGVGLDNTSLTVNVRGQNLGTQRGTMQVDNSQAQILGWNNTSVSGQTTVSGTLDPNRQYRITVTRADGIAATGACRIGVSQLSLGAQIFCGVPNKPLTTGIKLAIQEATGSGRVVSQNVTIDESGVVQGLTTKLQAGRDYKLSIEAPKALRRVVNFKAGTGTTTIPNFTLPVGDISPQGGDGRINSADKAQLNRDWISGRGTSSVPRSADFNTDGNVNSYDYACMKPSFEKRADQPLTTNNGQVVTQ